MYPDNDYRLYLEHHGIKGQKWGVRNAEWYPIDAWKNHLSLTGGGEIGSSSNTSKTSKASKASNSAKDVDHSKSDKSPLALYLYNLGLDAAMLATANPAGAAFLAIDLARGGQAVAASIKTKKVEKIRAKSRVDKKTGFHVKDEEMTEKEDMYMVNPSFANFDRNTKNNCMLCTTAYDMRRRGFEVSANKASTGYEEKDALDWYKGAKLETSVGYKNKKLGYRLKNAAASTFALNRGVTNKVTSDLLKQGDGARGNLMMVWDFNGNGHSVAYEVQDGKVILRDCQSNKVYKNPGALLNMSVGATYIRLDNVQPNYKTIKEAIR